MGEILNFVVGATMFKLAPVKTGNNYLKQCLKHKNVHPSDTTLTALAEAAYGLCKQENASKGSLSQVNFYVEILDRVAQWVIDFTNSPVEGRSSIPKPFLDILNSQSGELTQAAKLLLSLPTDKFIERVKSSILASTPEEDVMLLVAYKNAACIYQAGRKIDSPIRSIEDFILYSIHTAETVGNEIASRRCTWFYLAGLLLRTTELGEEESTQIKSITEIWEKLAESSRILPRVLQHNVLWEDNEKIWFTSDTEKTMPYYIAHIIAPKYIQTDIKKFPWESS